MKKLIILVGLAFLVSCAGRTPNPVMTYQYGDEKRSCKSLALELSQIENDISLLLPKSQKTGKNVALGVTGFFLIVPLFFMDFSEAEQIEINALRRRYNHLVIITSEKECGLKKEPIPAFEKPISKYPDEEEEI